MVGTMYKLLRKWKTGNLKYFERTEKKLQKNVLLLKVICVDRCKL